MKETIEYRKETHRRQLVVECEDMIQRLNLIIARTRVKAIFPHSILDIAGKIESHLRIIQALDGVVDEHSRQNPLDGKNQRR